MEVPFHSISGWKGLLDLMTRDLSQARICAKRNFPSAREFIVQTVGIKELQDDIQLFRFMDLRLG
jgi:hypothetical protein